MSAYDESFRRELRESLRANPGVPTHAIDEIVDLACLAADRAMEQIRDVTLRASSPAATITAFEIAVQLAGVRMQAVFERTQEQAKAAGLPRTVRQMRVPA